jgi:HlyD family secretion protein/epimerase transport system membrane fusion protein
LFTTRRDAALGRKTVFERQIEQLREQTVGVDAELKGNLTQLSLIEEELRGLQELLKTGNALKSRVLQVQRAQAEITGKASTNRASIAGIEQKIGEVRVTMLNAETEYRDKLADELMRVNGEIAQLEEKLQATRDLLARTTVTAPTEGTVLGMRFKTTKGVIRPGDVILQIVPTKDELVIDARVQPIDGKSIRPGQMAEVHLLPYVQRNLPMIEGRVISITPDTLSDERTGEKYYEAKVIVERNRLKEIAPEVELSPGMPADVMIVTGARSAFRYLMEPIERSFRLSFRQS